MPDLISISQQIKEYALSIGFDACGICEAEKIEIIESNHYQEWIDKGYHADMDYMARNIDKRCDPTLLVDNAKSIISLALNYYPHEKQSEAVPQFAYYAYGKDYHDVMKAKLQQLFDYIQTLLSNVNGRVFCDTAPVLERYWAAKAGVGFIGKNTLLIIPKRGSYFFLGEVIIDAELSYDKPLGLSCGKCTRCLQACPTGAIEQPHLLNAKKCISYQTIENKGEIDQAIVPLLNNRMYGCDICQQICPWNRYARPHTTEEFIPREEFLSMDHQSIANMTVEDYQRIFKGSAVKRAKYSGIMRNFKALTSYQKAVSKD
ncbi:epoxyqueuosine reductase [Dysgonomonas alginatilytica]|uniref:Epoxyqueuosine reductase n=1 Tax=Dysgonomonas alginatilytica TaxID=1605892 RepID=A0A2V3PMS4_9BACT|nr:tRNA epoxyqueuosine(34) reductase QueG [Dysgonomonas alginatilytica]PXV62864.1 epoxyqueuosine reductase [Dysgonomonas alginatilytica]